MSPTTPSSLSNYLANESLKRDDKVFWMLAILSCLGCVPRECEVTVNTILSPLMRVL